MLLLHSVFCAALKTTDNQVIQGRMTLSASRTTLEFLPGNAIFCAAIQAPNDYIFLHINTLKFIISFFA
jgi:hypothetical protein